METGQFISLVVSIVGLIITFVASIVSLTKVITRNTSELMSFKEVFKEYKVEHCDKHDDIDEKLKDHDKRIGKSETEIALLKNYKA